jgi:hypothetical protein
MKVNRLIVDRFEGEYAIVELPDKTMINILKTILPDEAVEGDIIEIRIDREETKNRKDQIKNLVNELWE